MLYKKSFAICIVFSLVILTLFSFLEKEYAFASTFTDALPQQEPVDGEGSSDSSATSNLIFVPLVANSSESETQSTSTPTATPPSVDTPAPSNTPISLATPVPTFTFTPIGTLEPTLPAAVPSNTPTLVPTNISTETPTHIATASPSQTGTAVPTNTFTPTPTFTSTPTPTATPTKAAPQVSDIGGRVGLDQNVDGFLDVNEPGIEGIVVNLLNNQGQVVETTSTGSGFGDWHFYNLTVDSNTIFSVAVDENTLPAGYVLTTNNNPVQVTISPSETKDGFNFGYASTGDDDELPDEIEAALGTNPNLTDTDFDQISDLEEVLLTGTDPTKTDSDGNGISDNLEDLDGDGLTNIDEVSFGTDPLLADSDGDTLIDSFEIREFNSDPLKSDTDDDLLTDDSEFRLGTDPRVSDSDGDGLLDGQEAFTTVAFNPSAQTEVELNGAGDVAKETTLQNLADDTRFQQLPGQISSAVDITTTAQFDSARVKIYFDPNQVPNADFDGLQILHYDENERVFESTAAHGVNVDEGYAWADTTEFSTFVLFHIPTWETVWTYEMEPDRDEDDANFKNIDVVIMLDSSGSMSSNDPSGFRRTAAIEFIEALVEGDRVGVVDFDSSARLFQSLTEDFEAAKSAVNRINSNGGTNIGSAVRVSNQELINNGDTDHLPVGILLTDGQGGYDESLTTQANDAGIQIYTIGLGNQVNQTLLQSIADGTGAAYYPIANADQLPEVFRRIAEDGGDDLDTDGDGLFDWLEKQGIRNGRGERVTTDPEKWDTDGDGLSDGEEVGPLQSTIWGVGSFHGILTDPNKQDTDGDGLLDPEELEIGTNPFLADTDGDTLSDALEVNIDFDPFNSNPDGDHRPDNVEYEKDSDPFYFDPTPEKAASYVLKGAILGDLGENFVQLGLLSEEEFISLYYITGWLASGVVAIGDVRDTLASLVRGDLVDTALNAAAFIPVAGDLLKVAKVYNKAVSVAAIVGKKAEFVKPLARWTINNFKDKSFYPELLKLLGYSEEAISSLSPKQIDELATARNTPELISSAVRQGVKFSDYRLTPEQAVKVEQRVNSLWKPGSNAAEAYAVESAVELLSNEYVILYVGRSKPLELADGTFKHLNKGPDIVAYNKATQRTTVVEVKGSQNTLSVSDSRLKSKVQGKNRTQPSVEWLATNPDRYLGTMDNASEVEIQNAADRLSDLIEQYNMNPTAKANYEAIVIGYSSQRANLGKLDATIEALTPQAEEVQFITLTD